MADEPTVDEIIRTVTAHALADGLTPPFVICLVNPDGSVLAVRTHPERPVELTWAMARAFKALVYCWTRAAKNAPGRRGDRR
jgi:hypothetical protein